MESLENIFRFRHIRFHLSLVSRFAWRFGHWGPKGPTLSKFGNESICAFSEQFHICFDANSFRCQRVRSGLIGRIFPDLLDVGHWACPSASEYLLVVRVRWYYIQIRCFVYKGLWTITEFVNFWSSRIERGRVGFVQLVREWAFIVCCLWIRSLSDKCSINTITWHFAIDEFANRLWINHCFSYLRASSFFSFYYSNFVPFLFIHEKTTKVR